MMQYVYGMHLAKTSEKLAFEHIKVQMTNPPHLGSIQTGKMQIRDLLINLLWTALGSD